MWRPTLTAGVAEPAPRVPAPALVEASAHVVGGVATLGQLAQACPLRVSLPHGRVIQRRAGAGCVDTAVPHGRPGGSSYSGLSGEPGP